MAEQETEKAARLPKTIEDIQAITHIPTTEATSSFGAFVNKYLTNADNFDGITPEQAWTVIGCHRVWQQSEERKQELADLRVAKEQEAVAKREEREAKKAEREAEKARKAEEKKAKAEAKKAAKEAAEAENGEDLDGVDAEGDGEIEVPKTRKGRKPRKPRPAASEDAAPETEAEPAEAGAL